MIQKIKCWLGLHKEKYIFVSNGAKVVCSHCDKYLGFIPNKDLRGYMSRDYLK